MKNKSTDRGIRFERRDILKLMTGVPATLMSVAPFTSAMATAAPQQPATQSGQAAYQPKVFNPHEWRTLRILTDLIMPADQRSGSATQAGVPEFIDDWLNIKGGTLVDEIRGGLTWLDMQSNRLFQYDFADCPVAAQKQILDRIAYPAKAASEDLSAVSFFNKLRDLVVSGFFTSQIGVRDLPYLGNEPLDEWKGCPAQVLAKLGIDNAQVTT
jgi:gluconate 2-dehydrogenase gamma chain